MVLIPYERTRIEVLAGAWLPVLGCLLLVLAALQVRALLVLGCWCLLLVLAALQVRALLVLACVVLIPYERTCIEVLACVVLIPYERTRIEVLTGAWLRFFGFWVSILLQVIMQNAV